MVTVEILGHKAKVDRVSAQAKQEPWHKEDHLVVWIEFDEAVGSTLSFAVILPVKKYADREEFLYNVCRRGGEELRRILARDEVEKMKREETDAHKIILDGFAAEAQKLID